MTWLTLIWAALLCLFPAAAIADDFTRAAGEIKEDLNQAREEDARALKDIKERKARLLKRLDELKNSIKHEKASLASTQKELADTHRSRTELSRRLEETSGDMHELTGNVRAAARDLLALSKRSPVTAEDPARLDRLKTYLDNTHYPGLQEIKSLAESYFTELEATGQVAVRQGPMVDSQGREVQGRLVRIGGFATIYQTENEVGFAGLGPETGRLLALAKAPSWAVRRKLEAFIKGETDETYLDISGGAALRQLSRQTGLWQQIQAGGPLVWPILLVGLIALALVLERLLFLGKVRSNTDVLMEKVTRLVAKGKYQQAMEQVQAQPGRPISNVIQAGLALKEHPPEMVESGLAEAMLRELPRLERFITALKVLAAIAPLLGLLGTVTGMINTFNVITVHGAGDPRLMAGGISEALITTQLGLAVAIPIMVAAALINRKAQRITGDMEEKAVALSAALIGRSG